VAGTGTNRLEGARVPPVYELLVLQSERKRRNPVNQLSNNVLNIHLYFIELQHRKIRKKENQTRSKQQQNRQI